MRYPREWEDVSDYVRRLKVPGGWIVHSYARLLIGNKEAAYSEALVFVPDLESEWVLESK